MNSSPVVWVSAGEQPVLGRLRYPLGSGTTSINKKRCNHVDTFPPLSAYRLRWKEKPLAKQTTFNLELI